MAPLIMLHYESGIFPSTALAAAAVTAQGNAVFSLPGSAGMATLDSSYGRWEWAGSLVDGDLRQSQVVIGVPLRKWGDTLRLRARFRLNNALRLDGLYLGSTMRTTRTPC